jgi:hypothetical protein
MTDIERLTPRLTIVTERDKAIECGDSLRARFGHAVDHLSAELARNDPATRDKIGVSWDELKQIPLFIYEDLIQVRASDPLLGQAGVIVALKALVFQNPLELHARDQDMGDREYGGRVLASLFPPDVRRRIDAEWVLAWHKSRDTVTEVIRLASDEMRAKAMEEQNKGHATRNSEWST